MGVSFTPDQQRAITLQNQNILVSAAAGSGKTAVLSARIVEMVCRKEEPIDIDRLLVVTFTNAAAAEMRERISAEIAGRLEENPANEHLQRQSVLLHNAQITTIDSFCLFILRNNFKDIGLDPAFRIADEGEMELFKQDTMAALLEEKFAERSEAFHHLVEYFCPTGRESVLEGNILRLYGCALSHPFSEAWLLARKGDYSCACAEEWELSEAGRFLTLHIGRLLQNLAAELCEIRALCEEPDGPYMYGEVVEEEAEAMERLAGLQSLTGMEEKIPAFVFGRLPSKKDDSVSADKRELAKKKRDAVKEQFKKLNEDFFFMPVQTAISQMQACSGVLDTLIDLTLEFKRRLDEKKREKNVLDFSDIEHLCLRVLVERTEDGKMRPTAAAEEYRAFFHEILIDEYQDSNLVQEYLLWAVSGEPVGEDNRFMVGDVKQSIYKFRLARPELFLEKYHSYPVHPVTQTESAVTESTGTAHTCSRIDLKQNFRSRPEVIDTVNGVFSRLMREEFGGIAYDEAAALYAGAAYPESEGCESELLLVKKPTQEEMYGAKEAEALCIAERIRRLMQEFRVTDKKSGQLRPLQYRDIAILLRSNSGWDEDFKQIFVQEGIPAFVTGKTGYFSTKEIQDLLLFLRVLYNPTADIPLFGAMKSVFGGFSDEEIALLKSGAGEGVSLYEGLKLSGTKKSRYFLSQIEKYREYAHYMPILELLQTLVEEYRYLAYVSALPAGEKRLANVEMLFTKAAAFEKNSYYGLFHFIRYIEQLEKYQVDFGEANTLDENADVVRIMSIHKSKGLEFPVVIVAGLSKRFNQQDLSEGLIVDMDLGIGIDYLNTELRLKNKTLRKNTIAAKMKADNLAEELRILYVAMTRAREKLIMTGTVADTEEAMRMQQPGAAGPLSYARLLSAGSFLDYVLPLFPDVQTITLEELQAEKIKGLLQEGGRKEAFLAELKKKDESVVSAAFEDLKSRFSYVYPHRNLEQLYTKTTVSELKKAAMETKGEEASRELIRLPKDLAEESPYIPGFMRKEEKISGTTRGSAMHQMMELLDLTKEYTLSELSEVREEYVREGRLTAEYAAAINLTKIKHFLDTPLAERMRRAARSNRLYREQPFVYGISAARLTPQNGADAAFGFPAEETVLIQGIVDAYFEEEGELVLLDYKTDIIDSPEELTARYHVQLDYYEEALQKLVGKRVKEKLLYSFYLEQEIKGQNKEEA